MKFDRKMIIILFIAALCLLWYIIHPLIVEGAISAASAETKLKIYADALNAEKFKKPSTDPVVLHEKLEILKQRRDLLTEVLKDAKFKTPKSKKIQDDKAAYEKLLNETSAAIPPLENEHKTAQTALDASRKKKKR